MPESFSQTVASTVKAEMARRNVTQRQVAEALGIAQTQVSRRLLGRISFNVDELQTVANLLDIPVAALIAGPAPLERVS